ncbi:hypothetical protein DFH06DRAFT_359401 [Mycena polygramma]|nr:hypothetical protein DFH06DRAFT_359401 [Mycena polygramma]
MRMRSGGPERGGNGHERVQYRRMCGLTARLLRESVGGFLTSLISRSISRLLDTKGGDFTLACGLDFDGIGLYDTRVIRDSCANTPGRSAPLSHTTPSPSPACGARSPWKSRRAGTALRSLTRIEASIRVPLRPHRPADAVRGTQSLRVGRFTLAYDIICALPQSGSGSTSIRTYDSSPPSPLPSSRPRPPSPPPSFPSSSAPLRHLPLPPLSFFGIHQNNNKNSRIPSINPAKAVILRHAHVPQAPGTSCRRTGMSTRCSGVCRPPSAQGRDVSV